MNERPYSQQESFSRSILHIGCFPSPGKSFRSMLWHISVSFSELQCTSWVLSPEVLMLQHSRQTAGSKHLSAVPLCGHIQTWVLENLQQLQLCNLQCKGNALHCKQGKRPTAQLCSGAVSRWVLGWGWLEHALVSAAAFVIAWVLYWKTRCENKHAAALGCVLESCRQDCSTRLERSCCCPPGSAV